MREVFFPIWKGRNRANRNWNMALCFRGHLSLLVDDFHRSAMENFFAEGLSEDGHGAKRNLVPKNLGGEVWPSGQIHF